MDMKQEWPIEIDIENNQHFIQIALLLDGTEIITEIVQFKVGDYDSWKNHLLKMAGFDLDEYWSMNEIQPDNEQWDKKSAWMKQNEKLFIKQTSLNLDF